MIERLDRGARIVLRRRIVDKYRKKNSSATSNRVPNVNNSWQFGPKSNARRREARFPASQFAKAMGTKLPRGDRFDVELRRLLEVHPDGRRLGRGDACFSKVGHEILKLLVTDTQILIGNRLFCFGVRP